MVLSTLHTNDAPSTINRLLNMGVEPFLVTASVNLIVAQRLARKVCQECKQRIEIPKEALEEAGMAEAMIPTVVAFKGTGCRTCSQTGYKGRIALYEVMPLKEELKELILTGASSTELKNESIRLGMRTLRQSGLSKLTEGITSLEEVLRCTVND